MLQLCQAIVTTRSKTRTNAISDYKESDKNEGYSDYKESDERAILCGQKIRSTKIGRAPHLDAYESLASAQLSSTFIKGGVQWKQGVVIYMMLCTILLYNTTPIHCTPSHCTPL